MSISDFFLTWKKIRCCHHDEIRNYGSILHEQGDDFCIFCNIFWYPQDQVSNWELFIDPYNKVRHIRQLTQSQYSSLAREAASNAKQFTTLWVLSLQKLNSIVHFPVLGHFYNMLVWRQKMPIYSTGFYCRCHISYYIYNALPMPFHLFLTGFQCQNCILS